MPTPVTKEVGLCHWTGVGDSTAGYRFQLGLRELGFDWSRVMLDAPNLGHKTTRQVHGAFQFLNTLAGDLSAAIDDALHYIRRTTSQMVLLDVGENAGDGAMISRGYGGGSHGGSHTHGQISTFSLPWQTDQHEHAAVNAVGTLANHWKTGATAVSATANGTAVQFTEAVVAGEEILFAWMEPDYPGPGAGTGLTGDLYYADDEAFTINATAAVTGLGAIGATDGALSGVTSGAIATDKWWRVQWTVTGADVRYPVAAFVKRPIAGYQAT